MNDLQAKEIEFQTLSRMEDEAARLRGEFKKVLFEVYDIDALLQGLGVRQGKVVAVRGQVAGLLSTAACATRRSESVCDAFLQKALDGDVFKIREAALKQRLAAWEAKLSCLNIECALLG